MKIYFGTGNENKLREAKEILDIEISGTQIEVDEVQSLDPIEVAKKKAWAYYKEIQEPIFVEDICFTFNALNKLPGTFIDYFSKALENEGLLKLLEGTPDRSAKVQITLVYINENKEEYVFEHVLNGKIAEGARGDNGFGWDPIFIPEGFDKTFAEMTSEEKNEISHRGAVLKKFKEFLDSQDK